MLILISGLHYKLSWVSAVSILFLCFSNLYSKTFAVVQRVQRPHIVFFLADDYGWADIGYHGLKANKSNIIATPNLDKLAKQGVKLENYYVQPVCSPTRAAIMTGRYNIHTGIHFPLVDSAPAALPIEEVTIAQKLKEAGYATHAVGKWHLGFHKWRYTPQERGFDSFFGYYAGSSDYWNKLSLCWPGSFKNGCFENTTTTGEGVSGSDLHRNRQHIQGNTEYSTNLYTKEAERIINDHVTTFGIDSVPLFLYLPHQAVHVGNIPTPSHPEYALDEAPIEYINQYKWVADEERRNLSAMVTVMDEAAGNVTRALKKAGLWNNTLFIFSTDNGGPTGKKASNFPLRGGKGSLWEGGVRGVAFVTAGSKQVGINLTGYENNQLMHVSDWLPTLCAVAGCKLNGTLPLDGINVWNAIAHNGTSKRKELLHDIQWSRGDRAAIRVDNFKLVYGMDKIKSKPATHLYDVVKDQGESNDLASAMPDLVAKLWDRIQSLNKSSIPPVDQVAPDPQSDPRLHNGNWIPWNGE